MKSRLDSQNFLTSIITVVIAIGTFNNVDLNLDPSETAMNILSNNWEYLLQVAAPTLITFVLKVLKAFKEKTFSLKGLLKSPNALTALITLGSVIITGFGIMIEPMASQAVTEAILSGSTVSIITALVTYLVNPLYHFIFDKKPITP